MKKINKKISRKMTLSIVIMAQIIVILVLASYSWFADVGTPSVTANQLKVTSANGLVIRFTPDGESTTDVDLAQLLTDINTFQLDQVSSANAKDFYTIDFGLGLSMQDPEFVTVEKNEFTDLISEEKGLIDVNFYLATEDFGKSIYFENTTGLFGASAASLRVAITIPDDNFTMIFGTSAENGIGDDYVTHAVIKTGTFEYGTVPAGLVGNQTVHLFSDMGGGRWTNEDAEIDLSKVLTQIPANSSKKVNLKIWLEGGDPDCTEEIASTFLNSVVKFGSANLLLNPPEVSATSGYRITGLNTNMEYSTDGGTTWTSVTDPSVSFSSGVTVYVRIKEVINTSPASYSTIINF